MFDNLFNSKTYLYFFEILIGSLMILLFLISCSGSTKNDIPYQDSYSLADDRQEEDAKFLVDAVEISMMEMQLGELAQKKAFSSDISELGKNIEEEHAASCRQLISMAKQKLVTLPLITTKKAQAVYDKLNEKANTHFDKAYCNTMISEHKDAIALFEEASTRAVDPDIKGWAQSMLPVLQSHLDRAILCQKKYKVL